MKAKELNFEEKIKKLEDLVKQLENGDIPLEEAITSFTNAMQLAKSCDNDLKEAETTLTKIVNEDGTLSEFKVD